MPNSLNEQLSNPYTYESVKILEVCGSVNLSTIRYGSADKSVVNNTETANGFKISTNADLTKGGLFVKIRMYCDLSSILGGSPNYKLVYLNGILTSETSGSCEFTTLEYTSSVANRLNILNYSCSFNSQSGIYELSISVSTGTFRNANIWYELDCTDKIELSDPEPNTYVEIAKINKTGGSPVKLPVQNNAVPLGSVVIWTKQLSELPWGWATCEEMPRYITDSGSLGKSNRAGYVEDIYPIPNLTDFIPIGAGKVKLGSTTMDSSKSSWSNNRYQAIVPPSAIPIHYHVGLSNLIDSQTSTGGGNRRILQLKDISASATSFTDGTYKLSSRPVDANKKALSYGGNSVLDITPPCKGVYFIMRYK